MKEFELRSGRLIDPRVSIIYTLIFSIIIALSSNMLVAVVGLISSIILTILIAINIAMILRRLLIVNIFILILWLILPFSTPGPIIFSIGGLKASMSGVSYALLISLKSNAIVITAISLLSSGGIFNLVRALSDLRIPDKLIYIFFLFYRYTYVLFSEYETIKQGLKIRGFEPKTSFHTYRTYGYVLGALLLKGYERSEKIHRAMLCRGFEGKYRLLDHFRIGPNDLIAIFMMALNIIILLLLQWNRLI